jgi:hypothetical protein
LVTSHIKAGSGGAYRACHSDGEVGDGSCVRVHEAEPPVCDGHVCNEHGRFRDGRGIGEAGKE